MFDLYDYCNAWLPRFLPTALNRILRFLLCLVASHDISTRISVTAATAGAVAEPSGLFVILDSVNIFSDHSNPGIVLRLCIIVAQEADGLDVAREEEPLPQPSPSGECMGILIVSTLAVFEPVLSFPVSGYRFDDSMLSHILQKI